jgi:hypothetical protein
MEEGDNLLSARLIDYNTLRMRMEKKPKEYVGGFHTVQDRGLGSTIKHHVNSYSRLITTTTTSANKTLFKDNSTGALLKSQHPI